MAFQNDLSRRRHRTFCSNKFQVNLLLRRHEDSSEGCYSFLSPMCSNVEVTGVTREDGRAVRPMMNQGGRTARLACRGASG